MQKTIGKGEVIVPTISKHLKNVYVEGELAENATISKMETVVNRGFMGDFDKEIKALQEKNKA